MSDLPAPHHETYLGDGLYASFDGWQIVLRDPREHGDHWIGLEPDVRCCMPGVLCYARQERPTGVERR